MKQMCRMLSLPSEKSYHLYGYWLGGFLRDTGFDENFPELADLGAVSRTKSKTSLFINTCWTLSWKLLGEEKLRGAI